MMMRTLATAFAALFVVSAGSAFAAEDAAPGATSTHALPVKHQAWSFQGVFGTYDREAVQRGYQIYRNVCSTCHTMHLLSFRNLGQPGGPFYLDKCPEGVPDTVDCTNPASNPIVKAIAASYQVQSDEVDATGDYVVRPGTPADQFPNPYAPDMKQNDALARTANGGALPPDLSVIVKAREHGPDYVYSLLTGYTEPPADVVMSPGKHYNPYFEGRQISMPHPLSDGIIDYEDENTPETTAQYAHDVVTFLEWAAEPKLEQRKSLGFMVMAYLLIFTGLLYWTYRKVWRNVEH